MSVTIRDDKNDEDMEFFFRLGFWALKTLRRDMYDEIMRENPNASEEEAFQVHKKETSEYMDFTDPEVKVFVASLDGERCGYIWMGPRNSRDGWDCESPQWIYDIVVDPRFQGKGIGQRLMVNVQEYAKALNQNIGLFVHADNESAISLYKKTGYRIKVIPISKKLSEPSGTESSNNPNIMQTDALDESLQMMELRKFSEKVRFSVDVDDRVISELHDKYLEKSVSPEGKQTRFLMTTASGDYLGSAWIGKSGFNDRVAMLYSIVVADLMKQHEVGIALMESVEAWAQKEGFTTVYVLLHSEDDLDIEFFQGIGYRVPGYFMELRLKE